MEAVDEAVDQVDAEDGTRGVTGGVIEEEDTFTVISLTLLLLFLLLLMTERRLMGSSRNKMLSFLNRSLLISDLLVALISDLLLLVRSVVTTLTPSSI